MDNDIRQSGQMGFLERPDLSRLTKQERSILSVLMDRPGRRNAIKGRNLGRQFAISGAEVRAIVHRLRLAGAPIGSGSSGYFWIADPEEARATARHLKSRIHGMAKVVAVLEGRTLAEVSGQLRMDLIRDDVTSPPLDCGKRPLWDGVDGEDPEG